MCALITVVLLQARQECHVANLPHTAPLEHLPSRGGDEKDATASCTIVLNALERSELLILGRLFLFIQVLYNTAWNLSTDRHVRGIFTPSVSVTCKNTSGPLVNIMTYKTHWPKPNTLFRHV